MRSCFAYVSWKGGALHLQLHHHWGWLGWQPEVGSTCCLAKWKPFPVGARQQAIHQALKIYWRLCVRLHVAKKRVNYTNTLEEHLYISSGCEQVFRMAGIVVEMWVAVGQMGISQARGERWQKCSARGGGKEGGGEVLSLKSWGGWVLIQSVTCKGPCGCMHHNIYLKRYSPSWSPLSPHLHLVRNK